MGLLFDGTTEYVDTGYAPVIALADAISMGGWIKTTSAGSPEFFAVMVNGSTFPGISMRVSGGKLSLWASDDGGTGTGWSAGTATVNDGAWHHVMLVRNRAADTVEGWVDGTKDIDVADPWTQALTLTGKSFFLGCRNQAGNPQGYFPGTLDDMCVWSAALSTAEIGTLYNTRRRLAPVVQGASLVRWWPLQGANDVAASGSGTVLDYSKNAGHGTQVNGPLYQGSPLSGPAKAHYSHAILPSAADQWNLISEGASPFSDVAAPSSSWSHIPEPTPAWA